MSAGGYVGRFAPSPTGLLHAGSLVAALASWLDARAYGGGRGGRWLVRIEDVDTPRCVPGAAEAILAQLAALGLHSDAPVLRQCDRASAYSQALECLRARALAYPCACTRQEIAAVHAARGQAHLRHTARPYPGTCRAGLRGRSARAWRFNATDFWSKSTLALTGCAHTAINFIAGETLHWHDRRLGPQQQDVLREVGDFVLRRADGLWAYQLAVVVDDAAQGVTHVVRGADLADNTPRQMLLQDALAVPTPHYLHTPLVRGADGEKLSKQHGAPALEVHGPGAALAALSAAACVLGLPALPAPEHTTVAQALALWCRAWGDLYNPPL